MRGRLGLCQTVNCTWREWITKHPGFVLCYAHPYNWKRAGLMEAVQCRLSIAECYLILPCYKYKSKSLLCDTEQAHNTSPSPVPPPSMLWDMRQCQCSLFCPSQRQLLHFAVQVVAKILGSLLHTPFQLPGVTVSSTVLTQLFGLPTTVHLFRHI